MRAPLSWLREFAPIVGAPGELAATLSGLGLAVEGIDVVGEGLDDVVVARVLATRAHPGAERVQLVEVDAGDGTLQIVCGAFNFSVGDQVALARIGAVLPGDFRIGRRKVRGQWSEGMLCSPAELALAGDASGILVLDGNPAPPGTPLAEALGIGSDVVFDIDVTPNRPDALSMVGLARDLAARLKVPFAIPEPEFEMSVSGPDAVVVVESADLCPRFTGTVMSGLTVGPSPSWLASRLAMAGMRAINNVVDISNYVMLELGQPNHPYDVARLGGGGLRVRRARPGETLVTLDDVARTLGPDDCVICDSDGTAVGLGGIMGGASSEIALTTATVLLEAAWFEPLAIARTSKRLGLRSEASVRFERGVDPDGIVRAVARFAQLAAEVAGLAGLGPTTDVVGELPGSRSVRVRTARVNAVLGTALDPAQVAALLDPIGFTASPQGGDFDVRLPSWRPDCEREIDVIEEVARHRGYNNIVRTLPVVSRGSGLSSYQRERRQVREILVGAGLYEAWATSFLAGEDLLRSGLEPRAVEVENPLSVEESLLRPSLYPGLLRALATNQAVRHLEVSLFEIGHVFVPGGGPASPGMASEAEHLGVALGGGDALAAARILLALTDGMRLAHLTVEAATAPGLHPTRTGSVLVDGRAVGVVGEADPTVVDAYGLEARVGWFEVDLAALLGGSRRPAVYRPVSRYPSADVDLAFVVDDHVPAASVEATLADAAGSLAESITLFDVFRGPQLGEGRRSLAFHLGFSALDHTLTDDELADIRRRCIEAVGSSHGASLRS